MSIPPARLRPWSPGGPFLEANVVSPVIRHGITDEVFRLNDR